MPSDNGVKRFLFGSGKAMRMTWDGIALDALPAKGLVDRK